MLIGWTRRSSARMSLNVRCSIDIDLLEPDVDWLGNDCYEHPAPQKRLCCWYSGIVFCPSQVQSSPCQPNYDIISRIVGLYAVEFEGDFFSVSDTPQRFFCARKQILSFNTIKWTFFNLKDFHLRISHHECFAKKSVMVRPIRKFLVLKPDSSRMMNI